jgi:probable HAF family extracellular repeat protein
LHHDVVKGVRTVRTLIRSFFSMLGLALCLASSAETRYRVTDLGAFPTGDYLYFPFRMTNQTDIIGQALNMGSGPGWQGFLWQPKTGYTRLPIPAGQLSAIPLGFGSSGGLGGQCYTLNGPLLGIQACVWDKALNASLLGPTPEYESTAADIAPNGTIYGEFDFMPAAWAPDGTLSFLPTPYPDFPFGGAGILNNAGDILGWSYDPATFASFPVVWDRAHHLTVIDTPGVLSSFPRAINDRRWVVGQFQAPDYSYKAFLWRPNAGLTVLPGLIASQQLTYATGINNRGQIVGAAIPQTGSFTSAVLWENGQIKDLNTLIGPWNGWFLSTAESINARGEITGFGVYVDPAKPSGPFLYHGYLLKPL